ncbi:GPI transamidase component PIG-S [Hypsibius exemplaris]|uniref:GPI transamidase component PIG-S n=1 Tax=Hypsibius exemplaris TaxID=2072580 RepID=A0A1W0XD99_HYPEX|nr:GPI transamidase component PIG-S [Hypsibius exemplaris]
MGKSDDDKAKDIPGARVPAAAARPTSDDRAIFDTFNIFFYIAVFCIIGLPIWWVTTTTSRSSLPFDEIDAFSTYTQEKGQLRKHHAPNSEVSVVEPSQKWKTFWVLPPTTAVDIVFTLVNPTPDRMTVSWDIERGLRKHLDPKLARLSPLANFTVSSQILRYLDAGIVTKAGTGTIEFREAAKIINSVESRLGSFSSNNHVLNFIVYVPPPDQQPLRLVDSDQNLVPTNAFITPRWGGVMIYSPDPPGGDASASATTTPRQSVTVDVQKIAEVFLTQFFVHLGLLDSDQRSGQIDLAKDLDTLIKKRTQMNVDDSISTLKSLASLLGQMGNIAINEVVGRNIYEAVRHINEAKEHFDAGDFSEALSHSRRAWEKSERAFYDPSLLEQLYFPDDQKFAIYVPLFLPSGLPVLMSAVKWYKSRKARLAVTGVNS